MSRPIQVWSDEERQRRRRILIAADARGIRTETLAQACGGSRQRVQRWREEPPRSHLRDHEMTALEAQPWCQGGPVVEPSAGDLRADDREQLLALAGEIDPGEKDELKALAKRHRRAAVGGILRLALSAKAEGVRLKAWEMLLERSDGKPLQATVDLTPTAPATEEDLRSAISRALTEHDRLEAQAAHVPAPPEETQPAPDAALPS